MSAAGTSTSCRIISPRPPPAGGMTSNESSGRGKSSLGGTTSNRALLQTINNQLDASRVRYQQVQEDRVRCLHEKDVKRSILVEQQHSARRSTMERQLAMLEEQEIKSHHMRHRLYEQQQEKVMTLKSSEIERRREFSSRRLRCIAQQDATVEELRVAVYHTPSPTRSPRNVSPLTMSREVAERVLLIGTVKRDPNEPMHSKEALLELQKQRDVQVEQQRIVQQQQLLEKKRLREDHLAQLKERLDEIVRKAREENDGRLRRKREEEARIGAWRWKKQHELRAEAIDRLDHDGRAVEPAAAPPRRAVEDDQLRRQAGRRNSEAPQGPDPTAIVAAEPPRDAAGESDEAPVSMTDMTADEL